MPTVSLSSWPLPTSSTTPIDGEAASAFQWLPGRTLLDVISQVGAHGYDTMEICLFHLESAEIEYLTRVCDTLQSNGARLLSSLLDEGEMSRPEDGARISSSPPGYRRRWRWARSVCR